MSRQALRVNELDADQQFLLAELRMGSSEPYKRPRPENAMSLARHV